MTKSKGTETLSDAQLLSHLKEYLYYDPETGYFKRTKSGNHYKEGDIAGGIDDGYVKIRCNRVMYKAHRIAWLFYYGEMPEHCIDHINGIRHDNRIINLRKATRQQNVHNARIPRKDNTTGFMGVCLRKRSGLYEASIQVDYKPKYLGAFKTPEEASKVYLEAKRRLHEFCTI